jgi:hypothetical protein
MQSSTRLSLQALDLVWQFSDPFSYKLFTLIEYLLSECFQYHSVGSFHLALALGCATDAYLI